MRCLIPNRILLIAFCLIMGGCASSENSLMDWLSRNEQPPEPPKEITEVSDKPDNGIRYRADSSELKANLQDNTGQQIKAIYRAPNTLYQPTYSHKSLSDYAEQLTMQLIKNGRQLNTQSKVGIASFVTLDKTLNQTTVLGNQLAEMLIVEVQSFGVQVVDFKATNNILVGASGDLVFSREASKLSNRLGLDYVLSGTLIRNEKGVRVNARIVSTDTKVVVSSAALMIPDFVVNALQPQYVLVGE